MALLDAVMYSLHMVFAGLWSGSVLFATLAVLPTAMDGSADPGPLTFATNRLRTVSRASAFFLFVTGGHLAGTLYTAETLLGTTRGYLVLAMLALWLALAGLVEVGASRLIDGFDDRKVREPAREARPFLLGAAVVAVLLLLDAGLLISSRVGLLQL